MWETWGSIPGLGRSTGGGHGNLLQYSCLENHHEWRRLAGYSPQDCKELDMMERLSTVSYLKAADIHPYIKLFKGQRRVTCTYGMASPTWWTWVWASSRSCWWTGRPGILQSMGSQRVRHTWATELNTSMGMSQLLSLGPGLMIRTLLKHPLIFLLKRSVGISICLYIVLLDPTDFRDGLMRAQLLLRSISTWEAMPAKGCCPVTTGLCLVRTAARWQHGWGILSWEAGDPWGSSSTSPLSKTIDTMRLSRMLPPKFLPLSSVWSHRLDVSPSHPKLFSFWPLCRLLYSVLSLHTYLYFGIWILQNPA